MIEKLSVLRCFALGVSSLVLLSGFQAPTQAALTHYVPFDEGYPAGNDLNGSGGSDLGFGSNTWFDGGPAGGASFVAASNLLAPAGLPVAGNHASLAANGDFDLAFYTMDQDNDGNNGEVGEDNLGPGVHWLSFIARADTEAFFGGLSLVKFFGPELLYIGKTGGQGGSEWGFDQGASGTAAAAGSDASQDTFLVVKLTLGPGANDDFADLYVNPTPGAVPPAVADIAGYAFNEDVNDNRAIDEIRLGGQNGSPFVADEIRIGMTFADVAVPEPATFGLMLVGAACGVASRRRR